MAEMAVERGMRAALPRRRHPAGQTIARRSIVRHAVTRYALRGLVLAGVAGAAWLFWSASAQAAPTGEREGSDPAGGVTGLIFGTDPVSLDGPVSSDGAVRQVATVSEGLLGGVVSPRSTVPVATGAVVSGNRPGGPTEQPAPGTAGVNASGTHAPGTGANPITSLVPLPAVVAPVVGVTQSVLGVAQPVLARATQPVARIIEPVAHAVQPVLRAVQPVARPAPSRSVTTVAAPHSSTVDARGSIVDAAAGSPITSLAAAVPAAGVQPATHNMGERRTSSRRSASPVGDRAGPSQARGAPNQPAPIPAPLQAPPVAGLIGASTAMPGSTSDGGATAVLPYRFAAGAVASHRPVSAADVAARPLTALVPTVSPD